MRALRVAAVIAVASATGLAAPAPSSGLVICTVGFPCTPDSDPPSVPPPELPDLVLPSILGVRLGAGEAGLRLNAPGSLLLHVPSGLLEAGSIDLRAGGVVASLQPIELDVGLGSISLCGMGLCDPFETSLGNLGADPFHVGISGSLSGDLELFAVGDLLLTTQPFPAVPEPRTALLLVLGLAGLGIAGSRRAGHGTRGRPGSLRCGAR